MANEYNSRLSLGLITLQAGHQHVYFHPSELGAPLEMMSWFLEFFQFFVCAASIEYLNHAKSWLHMSTVV